MSGELAVRQAILAGLRGDAALMDAINGIFDGMPVQATPPYIVLGESLASGWGARDVEGCEIRFALTLVDACEEPKALGGVLAALDSAMRLIPDSAEGWRILDLRFQRSRTVRGRDRRWSAFVDYRVRAVRD